MTNALKSYHLAKNPHDDCHPIFVNVRDVSFRNMLDIILKSRSEGNSKKQATTDDAERLFSDIFYCAQKPAGTQSSSLRRSRFAQRNKQQLEISTHILSEVNGLFLVAIKKPSLSRL